MKKYLIFSILFALSLTSTMLTGERCACNKLTRMEDCLMNPMQCCWEINICKERFTCQTYQIQVSTLQIKNYCQRFTKENCQKEQSNFCYWNKDQQECIFFPGCQFIQTEEDCLEYVECSWLNLECNRIENQCKNYSSQIKCQMRNTKQQYCYWDDSINICNEANSCQQLPKALTTDEQCRNQIKTCTVDPSGGCIQSYESCLDQIQESQCLWNIDKTQECVWLEGVCYEKYCSSAIRYKNKVWTQKDCNNFIKNQICYRDGKGGCLEFQYCSDLKFEIDCLSREQCTWILDQCFNRECDFSLFQFSFEQCQLINKNCIQRKEGGCQQLNSCQEIEVEESCKINYLGKECIWINTLTDLFECRDKQCTDAPLSFQTNAQCQSFFSGQNCITKADGGCKMNGFCDEIDIQIACDKDIFRRDCFWDDQNNQCLEKNCQNAPQQYTTHEECNQFLENCTISNLGSGCQQWTCINSLTPDTCKNNNNQCRWINRCQKKQCSRAQNQNTQEGCQLFMNTCILDNSGFGCTDIPLKCEAIIISSACQFRRGQNGYELCGWDGKKCIDKNCLTAPKFYTSTQECQKYLSDCVSFAYYSNGLLVHEGCMKLPNNCQNRLSFDNCEVIKQDYPNCVWNSINNQCIDKTCESTQFFNTNPTINYCKNYLKNQECQLNMEGTACVNASIECQKIKLSSYSHQNCSNYLNYCTVNSLNTLCIKKQENCQLYASENQCYTTMNSIDCIWQNNLCQIKQKSCQIFQCEKNTIQETCYKEFENETNGFYECFWYNDSCTTKFIIDSKDQCQLIVSNDNLLNHNKCQLFDLLCTVNSSGSNCQELKNQCNEYLNINDCSYSLEGECVYDGNTSTCHKLSQSEENCTNNNDQICIITQQGLQCLKLEVDCNIYTDQNLCNQFYNSFKIKCFLFEYMCTQIQASTDCTKINKEGLTFHECQSYSLLCSVNRAGTSCIPIQENCNQYLLMEDCKNSNQGFCLSDSINDNVCIDISQVQDLNCDKIYLGNGYYNHQNCNSILNTCTSNNQSNKCISKSCNNFSGQFNQKNCQNWLDDCIINLYQNLCVDIQDTCQSTQIENCTFSREGECIIVDGKCININCDVYSISICSNFLNQEQCLNNVLNISCFWNHIQMKCVTKNCESIEQSFLFDTHDECFAAIDQKCTLNSTGRGCMTRVLCHQYEIMEQCKIDINDNICDWNMNISPPKCQQISCETASFTLINHFQCNLYLSNCTVKAIIINNNQIIQQGCQLLQQCNNYLVSDQCRYDDKGKQCIWNDNICRQSQCEDASQTFISHSQCQDFMSTCTLSNSGNGCMNFQDQCEKYILYEQCSIDIFQRQCYWYQDKCQTQRCNSENETECLQQNICIQVDYYCSEQICEDYEYTTDIECKLKMTHCTTDGIKCVKRGECIQATHEKGCKTSLNNEQCLWIKINETYGYCDKKTCANASLSLQLEQDCIDFSPSCTVRIGGGCQEKLNCQLIINQYGCTKDVQGHFCVWNEGRCRENNCQDLSGQSHADCNSIYQNCTIGKNNKCIFMKLCEEYNTEEDCLYGQNGPCIWFNINDDINQNNGSCIQYQICEAFQFSDDKECKKVSQHCTTNGINCVPITMCNKTNLEGCVTGRDGNCMLITKNSTTICEKFTSCEELKDLKSMQECQQANKNCIFNGQNCIYLENECSGNFTQETCISEINCTWNSQGCLKTNNNQQSCLKLSKEQCFQNKLCFFNGNECKNYDQTTKCEDFIQENCLSNSISDHYCYFYQNKCQKLDNCSQLDNNIQGCSLFPEFCYYEIIKEVNYCKPLTCEINYLLNGQCTRIQNLELNQITFCKLYNNTCKESEFDNISATYVDCFEKSGYLFSWDINQNSCLACNLTISNSSPNQHNENIQQIASNSKIFQINLILYLYYCLTK